MTEVDVVIISFAKNVELEQVTRQGILSLLESESNIKFNVFVVESQRTVSYNDFPSVKTIYPLNSFGYNKYLNIGIQEGKADYIFLANNDLTYEKGWCSEILIQMGLHPEIMSASPFCPQTQHKDDWKHAEAHIGYAVRRELAGWAIFIRRKLFDTIENLFDDRFLFWYADNDYGLTLRKHGITHVLVTNSVVNHHEHNLGKTGNSVLTPQEMNDYTMGQYNTFHDKWK